MQIWKEREKRRKKDEESKTCHFRLLKGKYEVLFFSLSNLFNFFKMKKEKICTPNWREIVLIFKIHVEYNKIQ